MGRPGITREQVFETASAIAHEGTTPTVMAVRKRLGGGSPNNITKWLGEWKAQHETTRVEALPPLPEPVEAAMRQVWGSAWKGAHDQLASEREALSAARKEIERERAEMLAEISRLDGELDEARAETQERDKALDEARRSHDETRAELREARVLVEERSRRIDEQAAEIQEVRRQSSEAQA
ncbi:MAG: DNA-binding protein, partial [Sphingobacteriia bacterium]|nr:DNA-binding protein [Sphingobacteriia bacterium]